MLWFVRQYIYVFSNCMVSCDQHMRAQPFRAAYSRVTMRSHHYPSSTARPRQEQGRPFGHRNKGGSTPRNFLPRISFWSLNIKYHRLP